MLFLIDHTMLHQKLNNRQQSMTSRQKAMTFSCIICKFNMDVTYVKILFIFGNACPSFRQRCPLSSMSTIREIL